ncbi:MAG TPA: hypothetical protein P5515_10280 [Methanolinea sp.]|nr:hypothetical protein [Methanolinea sp.]
MAKKCPHFSAGKDGRWLTLGCTSPDPCPDHACPANPCYTEPDPDGADE